jgi:hypothetical protein
MMRIKNVVALDPDNERPTGPSFKERRPFQAAMLRAVRRGREHPPMIGVWRDPRPPRALITRVVPMESYG